MNLLHDLTSTFWATVKDVAPIVLLIAFFQIVVLRKPMPHLKKMVFGIVLVILGLTFFLIGLEKALFPIGEVMATQLSSPEFLSSKLLADNNPMAYFWIYLFAALIGFATTIAEPSLIAVAIKAKEVSGGAIGLWSLRLTVAVGVAIGLALGAYRIVVGTPLFYYIVGGYLFVVIQTVFAPKNLVALAYDTGGVTTSTVTVPIVTALGLGLAGAVPGRSAALDGFGLIAFASVFPVIAVLGYIQIVELIKKFKKS
jgi:hypothetical protein